MVDRTRKLVPRRKSSLDFEYDSLETALRKITQAIEDYGKDATIKPYNEPYDTSNKQYLGIYAMDPETDEELKRRIDNEERHEKAREKHEKAEFERLRKKFG